MRLPSAVMYLSGRGGKREELGVVENGVMITM
jgi:hypothetical protein